MSDARAATDLQVQAVVALQEHLPSFMLDEPIIRIIPALCARIDADAARIRELEARQVPDGWQVVPKEPTVAMERSAAGRDTRDEGIASMYSGIYRAMLAAAPRP